MLQAEYDKASSKVDILCEDNAEQGQYRAESIESLHDPSCPPMDSKNAGQLVNQIYTYDNDKKALGY